ncbi:MAG: cytidylate kinase-like family protein [Bacteroidales bacterium]|nr:cytidylate kinase-like family protein [Bacteroidales bacterium]
MQRSTFILTIGRQIGAGGLRVANLLSERLDIPMYDKNLLAEMAKASGFSTEIFLSSDERPRKRGLSALFSGSRAMSPLNESLSQRAVLGDDNLFSLQSEVMHTLAAKGSCIFVGRCADYILRDCPNLLSVFISAPLDERAARVGADHGFSLPVARRFVSVEEKRRADYYNYFTFKKWGDSSSYDLCISAAGEDGRDRAAELILFALRQRGFIK